MSPPRPLPAARRCPGSILPALALALLTACGSTPARQATSRPEGPPELVLLDMLVGTWEGSTVTTLPDDDRVLATRAVTRVSWTLDGRFLEEHTQVHLEGSPPLTSLGLWTWDPSADLWRYWRFTSNGQREQGTLTFHEPARTWYMESLSTDLATGRETTGSGFMRFTGEHEKLYGWTAYGADGESVIFDAQGRSRRVGR